MGQILDYDIEVYPNIFTFTLYWHQRQAMMQFEVSWRRNQMGSLLQWLNWWEANGYEMAGYNNLGYDYPVTHKIMTSDYPMNAMQIYLEGERLINTPWERRWDNRIAPWNVRIKQHDLMSINHFDAVGKMVSLKELEFKMRMENIEDLPFEPGKPIPQTDEAADLLLSYNAHDVRATHKFRMECKDAIQLRADLTAKYGDDFTNKSEAGIGKTVIESELKRRSVKLKDATGQKIQTLRDNIPLAQVVFPYINFETPEFNAVLNVVNDTVVDGTKGDFSHDFVVGGVEYRLALGGIHASVRNRTFRAGNGKVIKDADVTSYYPQLGIKNKIAPAHIPTDIFCNTVQDLFEQRQSFSKKTHPIQNYALKIVINAIYGLTNDKFSPILDPLYTMTITVNGQLLLCMLAERLIKYVPGLEIIQCNTDGVTAIYDEIHQDKYDAVCNWWQQLTLLNLEYADYSVMAIRDVNNYLAVDMDGDIKRKGAYNHSGLSWDKDHSALVIKKAAESAILDGTPVRKFIAEHDEPMDFMLFTRVTKTAGLHEYGPVMFDDQVVFDSVRLRDLQRATRYYISEQGTKLVKTMPPLRRRTDKVKMFYPGWTSRKVDGVNKNIEVQSLIEYERAVRIGYRAKDGGTYSIGPVRETGIDKNWLVTVANDLTKHHKFNFNFDYYISEAEKLVKGVTSE